MAEITTLIEEAQLMKQNKADLVAALNEIGFTSVTKDTPLSSIAKYMKWAGGLLDIRLATFSKSTKKHRYWTQEEWLAQSAQTRSSHIQMGIVIRAERQEFIIAKDNQTTESGSLTIQWAPNQSNDVKGLTNYNGISTLLEDIDGEANTDLIIAAIEANGIDYPAARRAREYICCSLADGGVEDPTKWNLPAVGQMVLLYKYFNEIQAALSAFGMAALINEWYWSSTEASSAHAVYVNLNLGSVHYLYKSNACRVRPVSSVAAECASVGAI